MQSYICQNPIIEKYYKILCDEFPEFLYDYIQTDAMQRIGKIGCNCGTEYTHIFNHKFFYSNLDHSIGVALIIWNFTHDKKQTLAGLFHDISTPVFKHCIDAMYGDYLTQEVTENLTEKMITDSNEIMNLLKRDNIQIEEVRDYHIYPIADNDTPKLSADRLEYTLAEGMYFRQDSDIIWTLEDVEEIYKCVEIQKNEEGIEELGFNNIKVAEKFINGASKLWKCWVSNEDKLVMQFVADIVKEMSYKNFLTQKDLYTLSENEVIKKIENCKDERISNFFKQFRQTEKIGESDFPVEDKYCIGFKTKQRYIIPLVKENNTYTRINQLSPIANQTINEFLTYETPKYAYLDFKF